MSPKFHIACGTVSGTATYIITKSLPCSFACCLANFLFDLDHCLEYAVFCIKNTEKPSLKHFFSGKYFEEKKTLCVIFHGYEYIFIFLVISILSFFAGFPTAWIWAGILIGYSEHMIFDLIGNDCSLRGYSLIYRAFVHFDINKICTRNKKCG